MFGLQFRHLRGNASLVALNLRGFLLHFGLLRLQLLAHLLNLLLRLHDFRRHLLALVQLRLNRRRKHELQALGHFFGLREVHRAHHQVARHLQNGRIRLANAHYHVHELLALRAVGRARGHFHVILAAGQVVYRNQRARLLVAHLLVQLDVLLGAVLA